MPVQMIIPDQKQEIVQWSDVREIKWNMQNFPAQCFDHFPGRFGGINSDIIMNKAKSRPADHRWLLLEQSDRNPFKCDEYVSAVMVFQLFKHL